MDWTPIKQQFPEMGGLLLLSLQNEDGTKKVAIGYVDASQALHLQDGKEVTKQVVAWMPYPEPYAGE